MPSIRDTNPPLSTPVSVEANNYKSCHACSWRLKTSHHTNDLSVYSTMCRVATVSSYNSMISIENWIRTFFMVFVSIFTAHAHSGRNPGTQTLIRLRLCSAAALKHQCLRELVFRARFSSTELVCLVRRINSSAARFVCFITLHDVHNFTPRPSWVGVTVIFPPSARRVT